MSPTAIQLEWVRPPHQARSQQTLERLLDAAEALIDEKGIENATVAEIARRANSSVGSFYARFNDKEALIRCLFDRFNEQAIATSKVVITAPRWQGVNTIDALETMLAFMLRVLEERRHLIVALTTRTAQDPSLEAMGQKLQDTISRCLLDVLEERGETSDHPDLALGIRVAVGLCLATAESRALHPERKEHPKQLNAEQLAAELARMCVRYLGIESNDKHARATERPDFPRPSAQHTESRQSRTPSTLGSHQ